MCIDHFPAKLVVEAHCIGRCMGFQPDYILSHGQSLDGDHHGSAETLPLAICGNCNHANHAIPVPGEIKTDGTDRPISINKNQRKMLRLSVVGMLIIVPGQSAQIEQHMPSNSMIRLPFRSARYPYQLHVSSPPHAAPRL